MKFRVKEKMVCMGNDFWIHDTQGEKAILVDGRAISLRNTLVFKDRKGQELGVLREKMISIRERYSFFIQDELHTRIIKNFTILHKRFEMLVKGKDVCVVSGNFGAHRFEFKRGNTVIGKVSKEFFGFSDGYEVEVMDTRDVVPILATTIAIDQTLYSETRSHGYA